MADRLSMTRDSGTPDHITVHWTLQGDSWVARRTMPGINKTARLPELDAEGLLVIMKHMRDFHNRSMDPETLIPGELEN